MSIPMVPVGFHPPMDPTAPPGGWPAPNTTCPPGLEYLMPLDSLFVKQKVEMLEAFVGWETKNKYGVLNARGETIYHLFEESNWLTRCCMGSDRPADFHVTDMNRREVITMSRPLRCSSCCFPCCLQEMEVWSQGQLLGSIVQEWSIFRPWFEVRNHNGEPVLRIKGPLIRFCVDVKFRVVSLDGEHKVGSIQKKWSGVGRELFTDADNFGITFPMNLDVRMKAVLLGACILIDYMYFEETE